MPITADRLADVFERAPTLVARLAAQVGPEDEPEAVIAKAREVIAIISERERVAILNAHPRIGADRRALSVLSRAEQGTDGDAATLRELDELNEAYERKFGFRFVVFVNRRPKTEILEVMRQRLERTREEELDTAVEELVAIAEDRWRRS